MKMPFCCPKCNKVILYDTKEKQATFCEHYPQVKDFNIEDFFGGLWNEKTK